MPKIFAGNATVMVGLVIAALGIWLSRKFGNPHFDPEATLVIGVVLIGAAFGFTRKSNGLMTGAGINRNQIAQVREILSADRDVESVGQLQTVQIGSDSVLLTAGVRFARRLNPHEVEQATDRLERSIKEQYPAIWRLCLETVPREAPSQPD